MILQLRHWNNTIKRTVEDRGADIYKIQMKNKIH